MAYHLHLSLLDVGKARLDCVNWIQVRVAPDDETLMNATGSRLPDPVRKLGSAYPNNPLDPNNRIARIKSSLWKKIELGIALGLEGPFRDRCVEHGSFQYDPISRGLRQQPLGQ